MSVSFLEREGMPKLAYQRQNGHKRELPTLVFLHGFRSDMMGTKAEFLAQECERNGQSYLRFDYSGHGQSGGKFEDGNIGVWLEDTLAVIDQLTEGKILLIGSSMGGWIGLHVALARQQRMAGFIGLAAAPDFTRWILDDLSPEHKKALQEDGKFVVENEFGGPYTITQNFFDDGERQCLLDQPIELSIPVRLVQGMKDDDVPWQAAHRIVNAITGQDKKVYLLEEGGHRLSRPGDLELLAKLVAELSA